MNKNRPEATINYSIYKNGVEALGTAKVSLPDLTQKTIEISGAGIAGSYNSPITGHIDPMTATFTWTNVNESTYQLSTPEEHIVDLRAAQQARENGEIKTIAIKHVLKMTPTKLAVGELAPASTGDATTEYSVSYFATYIDGKKVSEVDVLNYIYFINGKDYLEEVRKALGK